MFERHYGSRIVQWPVGIDTDHWRPCGRAKEIDILLYDKKRWDRESFDSEFTDRIRTFLVKASISFNELRYGSYRPEDLENMVQTCKAAVFICESETQGLAYQQMLSAGLPLFVWDRQLHWYCPGYNVGEGESERATSVPYWDERCGMTFKDVHEFETGFAEFMSKVGSGSFAPRDYILEHLTLEKCARHYVEIIREVREEIGC
jgi:glycosyltransferase involved in cell wall biosynthesis